MSTRHFFTFGTDTPYRNLYVEVEVPLSDPIVDRPAVCAAREAMVSAHGMKWSFQYDEEKFRKQIEEYGFKRLSLIVLTGTDTWMAADVLGSE